MMPLSQTQISSGEQSDTQARLRSGLMSVNLENRLLWDALRVREQHPQPAPTDLRGDGGHSTCNPDTSPDLSAGAKCGAPVGSVEASAGGVPL